MPCVIDLFAGAGGLSLGAERAGFRVVAAVEIDKFAIETHSLNFPKTDHLKVDLASMSCEAFKDLVVDRGIRGLDGVIGGPPCQGFSTMGQRNVEDDRNNLFIKFFQIVAALKPMFFVAENVPGILSSKYDCIREEANSFVQDYKLLDPITITASEYGAPTTRTRVFFIGYKSDMSIELSESDFDRAKKPSVTVMEALEGLPSIMRYSKNHSGKRIISPQAMEGLARNKSFFYSRVYGRIPDDVGSVESVNDYHNKGIVTGCFPTKHCDEIKSRYKKIKCGKVDSISKSPRLLPDGLCPTLRAGTGPERGSYQAVRPIHFRYPRVITPREAARLQGFPDWFVFQPTIWHSFRQIGNSVSPLVSEQILSVLYQKLTS